MNNIIFFDSEEHLSLLPLTYTKPVSHLRVGILKIYEKWEKLLQLSSSNYTQKYLESVFPMDLTEDNLFIQGGLLPTDVIISAINKLQPNQALIKEGTIIAARGKSIDVINSAGENIPFSAETTTISWPWDIFTYNSAEIENDILLLDPKNNVPAEDHVKIIGDPSKIYIHPTAKVYASSLNSTEGPIFIGENTEIMEGSVVRGPFALCHNSTLKMGAKIYGGTTIGPHSKVGGEVGNSVIQGYTNKGHDGYLGNSVLGEWCNLGADTNTSNLKNNYSNIRVWNYLSETAIDTKLTFCGLIMGDHSKTGINTMFNTGTVVGVGSNIFGASFPPKFIPSYSWGSGNEFTEHRFSKFCSTAELVMSRRGLELSENAKSALLHIFETSKKFKQ